MVEEFFKSISIVFYEALCCGIFLNMFLEQRYPARWLKSLSVFLLTGVFLFWALITQTGGHYVFRSIGIIISIALFAVIFYTGKWLLKIFLSFIFYAILFCVDYLGLILVDLLLDSADLSNSVIQVILVLLCKTVLFVIVLILDYFWKREKELDVKKSEWILMISFPMMTVVIMLVMLLSFQQKNNSFGYLTVSFGMVSINLVMFVLLKYISAREKQYNQMKILQERNKEKMQAYYEFSEDYAQKKRMVHDYNNQIHCIQGLLRQNKYREAEEYADKLTEIQDTEDTAYLLENNEIFYDVGYKVMQNQENANLLRCHRIKYNGKIKLIYFTREYTSLEDYIASSDMDTILNAIHSLLEALIQIENLGFLNMACIDNRLSHIYVESGTNNVKIIYLPVNITGVHKNKNEFDNEIKAQLVQKIERIGMMDHPKMRQVIDALEDGTLKLHDISTRIQAEKPVMHRNTKNTSADPNIGQKKIVDMLDMNQISIQSIDGQFHFVVCENEFLIGKSRERVQGVITGNNAVSRVHCKIVRQNGSYFVVDMGSSNGTYVNGKRIQPNVPEPISDRSQLRIANAEFIVRG